MLDCEFTLPHATSPTRGVFCLETDWADVKTALSVQPMLELLRSCPLGVPFIHRNVATRDSMRYYLTKWAQRAQDDHPILYMAFHGLSGELHFGDQRRRDAHLTLDDLEKLLEGRCEGRIIHFGSCQTIDITRRRLRRFIDATGIVSVSGFRQDVDWVRSAILDFALFAAFQQNSMTVAGMRAVRNRLARRYAYECRALQFRMETRVSRRARQRNLSRTAAA